MTTLKVLIVDDEPGIRSGISRILQNYTVDFPFAEEPFQYETIEAATGEEALQYIENENIDIILLDNKLPGIQGVEVLQYINEKNIDTYVMMITSYASLDLAIKATKNGAYNFVPKPFTPNELKAAMEGITKYLYLRRMTNKLNEESRKTRFQFLSVLSHELKSPINAIEGYLRIMQDRQVGNNLDDYENMILRSLERIRSMRTLISDLLDLTKIESGGKKRQITKVDLVHIAQLAIDNMLPLASQQNVKIYLDSSQSEIYINADASEMEIILNNLLSNAIKYNKTNGSVYCSIKDEPQQVVIEVKDTGIGMSAEDISKLFQEFVRIRNEKTKSITGTGLGLSIVKKLVSEYYNGQIKVSSEVDKGSTFTIEIPKN